MAPANSYHLDDENLVGTVKLILLQSSVFALLLSAHFVLSHNLILSCIIAVWVHWLVRNPSGGPNMSDNET